MKVSFLELYNEELTDLLAPEESKFSDDKSKKPIALMEDGKGGVFVRGLEEELVSSAAEIYRILERGSAKRKTAETLLNKQSSRSHSIFSITIHIKECTHEGEEMIKCGKLNLVDLAGSENISRSGARDVSFFYGSSCFLFHFITKYHDQAVQVSNTYIVAICSYRGELVKLEKHLGVSLILLLSTLDTYHTGQSNTSCSDCSLRLFRHLKFGCYSCRDSKLTRLLRDSLGGKTKTCIIATIAPSVHCLEETLSTLDYAHRAKHIKNKPEVLLFYCQIIIDCNVNFLMDN